MRVVDDREVIVVDEELESLAALAPQLPRAQHLNVAATQLRTLNVTHNALASLWEMASLTHLRVLQCSHNEIADLSWLAGLHALQELWATHNRIESAQIAHLQSLSQLGTLVLHPNPCTESPSFVVDAVRTLPWLERVDTVVVDQALRDAAQHTIEREVLSTGSTDCPLYLLSGRSDDGEDSKPSTPVLPPRAPLSLPPVTVTPHCQPPPPRKSKREIAEELMRNFPVQDYIPVQGENQQRNHDGGSRSHDAAPNTPETATPLGTDESLSQHADVPNNPTALRPKSGSKPAQADEGGDDDDEEETSLSPEPTISSIASAVLSLPTFSYDGFLKRHASKSKAVSAARVGRKKNVDAKSKGGGAVSPPSKLPTAADEGSFAQDEWLLAYPNTTVTAVHVRSDGSAIAKWPNGAVAVSVDRERDGFRTYAAHKDGLVALSFDSLGVGFVNYHPSGKMMISTTSGGDGLFFSSDGSSILRQWDAHLNIKDEHFEPTDALGVEGDSSLLCKLSEGIGVRVQLVGPDSEASQSPTTDLAAKPNAASPILLTVYFATTSGIRYKFVNTINRAPLGAATAATLGQLSEACDCVFGKQQAPASKREENKPPPIPHVNFLHDIRAAVAGLQS